MFSGASVDRPSLRKSSYCGPEGRVRVLFVSGTGTYRGNVTGVTLQGHISKVERNTNDEVIS